MNRLFLFDTLPSTNSYAKEHIDELPDRSIISARRQTAGRGRLGRAWTGPEGNISMSLLYKNQTGDISLYPLFCGLAVCRALKQFIGDEPQMKWPNDILLRRKKLCGILCESIIFSSQIHIICGIGINVNTDEKDFGDAALPYATSLKIEYQKEFPLTELIETVSREMDEVLSEFHSHGFVSLKEEYERLLFNKGRAVQVIYKQKTLTGTALGIAENGNLLCDCDGTVIAVNSGEASVRGLYGYV